MMNHENSARVSVARLTIALVLVLAASALCPFQAAAQMPARFYWKALSGANAVPVIVNSISGNSNPFDPAQTPIPGATVDGTIALAGYAHTFTLFDRAAMVAGLLEMGRLSGELAEAGRTISSSARGFGDPTFEFNVNLIGPKAQKNLADVMPYQPGFSLDLIADLVVPIGEYDASRALNLGQNRWSGRLGFPVVWQIGSWVPGRRTTLELLPAVWFFGTNDDYVGTTLETDPLFQVDAHLTRDFTSHFWGSLDGVWYTGGAATIHGVEGEKLNNLGVGLTIGYQVNDSLGVTFGYKSTINDKAPGDLQMDQFMVSVVYGWHSIVEGVKRLRGGE
jgi:hypothetical protein